MSYDSGLIMDIETGEVILSNLAMPHSPTVFDNKLYYLLSATGDVMCYDLQSNENLRLANFNTFVRGMEVIDDFIVLGMSKIREGSHFFTELPVNQEDSFCGLRILDRISGRELAGLTYTKRIQEIFAVRLAKGVISPAILTDRDELHDQCIQAPESKNYWLYKKEKGLIDQD
jgi:uncharacterized protein (TIGR03032 family)